ncbi:MAG: DNA topoisomerase VI subunit B [Myxococcota bacterium]|jgi:DNA topoisomerase-6 subunit B|nr:DNA topoisomerase VI subunit B [Deltaproteobacteria bacterium]MCP4240042.1 DNA topoisomerase VI subunit B [bacterium]MDP6075046.1 DNA topoisomerase VI subunit B [Myxococcota bacterium]MDP7432780.1 DNA topoisomerase VI subunit B [Myxococcota bacterium]
MATQEQFAFGAKKGGGMSRPRKKAKTAAKAPGRTASARTSKQPKKAKAPRSRSTAADMAKKQRDISVSEFFAKNRHLLGFDNPSKALLTTVKEGVDNSLDACEEAGILPDIVVQIEQVSETRFRIAIQDNGPGIVKSQVPKIFGSLLYGSKFHRLRQSRGQQGIGISAAGMYGLLTTGKPIVITTRTGANQEAHHFELVIDTKRNEPKVKIDHTLKWEVEHGTRVEIELEGAYRGGQHSVDSYIRQISLANPHAEITYVPPKTATKEKEHAFPRVSEEAPPETAEIKPHPYGVELGVLMQMFRDTKARNLRSCLQQDFSRVSARTATEICARAKVLPSRRPSEMSREESEAVHGSIQATKIMAPPTNCIAPIGEKLIEKAMRAEVTAEFYAAVTRRPAIYRGNPFLVEVGLAYGGDLPADAPITVFRYANRVPLQYQQGGCAITKGVTATDWKSYQLQQPRGALPIGPALLMVHIASVWVPFTSESKEAIAHYPEIIKEIKLGLQECGRRVATHIRRRRREADEAKKRAYIEKYIPQVAIGLQQILGLSDKETAKVTSNLTDVLERSRKM